MKGNRKGNCLRQLTLSKSGIAKVKSHMTELKANDFEGSIKSSHPGEWCLLKLPDAAYIGFINPLVDDQYTCFYIIEPSLGEVNPLNLIKDKIIHAYAKREQIKGYLDGCRLFYGASDCIPGLIVVNF